jgi:hypothetical protein
MEQRICKAGAAREVGRVAQQRREGMVGRKRFEARGEVADFGIRVTDAEAPAVILQHINSRATVGRIDHHVHRAVWLEHAAQSRKPASGSGKWCSTPVETTYSNDRPSSAARSTAVDALRGCRARILVSTLA